MIELWMLGQIAYATVLVMCAASIVAVAAALIPRRRGSRLPDSIARLQRDRQVQRILVEVPRMRRNRGR